jgi:glycosyltransferase involved in cell wall biosynthesis
VYDAHESYADMLAQNVAPWIKGLVVRAERALIRRADAVITVGEQLAEELRRRGGRDVLVVGNWKRLDAFRLEEAETAARRAELGLGDRCLVVYIGYLNHDRGILPLLDAVRETDGVGLLLGGDGDLADAVQQAVGECWRVHYLGFVNPAEIPICTAMADVVYYGLDAVNPNARFSAPNKLFEALAAGKAVLCNDCGEVGRIVRAEGCGIVVDELTSSALRSALDELTDAKRLAECQRSARKAGQRRYNWRQAEGELLGLYHELGLSSPENWRDRGHPHRT